MVNRANERMDRVDREIRDLAASQRETDRMLKSLIRSLERGGNGHGKVR
jgi:hypothetical protein